MSDISKILEGLEDEQAADIISRAEEITNNALRAEVEKLRQEGSPQAKQLREEYVAAMTNPAIRGKAWLVRQVKEKYRKIGVDVDRIAFT